MQDAQIEDIAREVGITRSLFYRCFPSKEELFVLTDAIWRISPLPGRGAATLGPVELLEEGWAPLYGFLLQHPAFLDCGLSLMRGQPRSCAKTISDGVWIRLAQSMAGCLGRLSQISPGRRAGVFKVEDPDFTANYLYTQTLGTMHLARVRTGYAPSRWCARAVCDRPTAGPRGCIADVLASVGAPPRR